MKLFKRTASADLLGLPGQDALRPRGGHLLKNLFAGSLVALGNRRSQGANDWALINQRVSPAPGKERSYNDSFVFQGSSAKGDMVMSRLGFREEGSTVEVWVLVKVGDRVFVNEDTLITLDRSADPRTISAGGLSYVYDADRDTWAVRFEGDLVALDGGGEDHAVRCALDLVYASRAKPYLSSVHMDPWSTGKAMAEMPWSKAYFRSLRSERQVRVEGGGELTGRIEIDGEGRDVALRAFRDHSWGKRTWTFINRYIWNILSLNEPLFLGGEPYQSICYTTVDYGSTFRHLVSGWIAGPASILPIVEASDMRTLAGDGVIPEVYPIVFRPKGHRPLWGEVTRSPRSQAWLVQDGAFEVNEAYCNLLVEGIDGQGMSEFGFAKHTGIPRPAFSGGGG